MATMKNLMSMLDDIPGVVTEEMIEKAYLEGVRHPSPSFNAIFGNTHCIPSGASACFWGPFKGGKTYSLNAMIGQLHKDDEDAVAIKFDTEMREQFQMTPRMLASYGIDSKRYRAIQTNKPDEIFDFIENKLPAFIQKGMKIKLVGIDSINEIMGRRAMNTDTVMTQQIGDEAATIKDGLKRIRATLRRYGVTLIMIAQERDELDQLEIMRGRKKKMAGANALKHFAEFFIRIEPNQAADGRIDALGVPLLNKDKEPFAHKIKMIMQYNSLGPRGRTGEFTLNYNKGIVSTNEEVSNLAIKYGAVERPNNRSYIVKNFPSEGKEIKFSSLADWLAGIAQNEDLAKELVRRVRARDIDLMNNGIKEDEALPPELEDPELEAVAETVDENA